MKKDIRYGNKIRNGIKEVDYDKWIDVTYLSKKNGKVDWANSIGKIMNFKYNETLGCFKILKYAKNGQKVNLYYNGSMHSITSNHLFECKFGKILKVITDEFKINIGDSFNCTKENNFIYITERDYKKNSKGREFKWYRYKCSCGNEDWIVESALIGGQRCNVCSGRKALLGINTIWDKARWMVDLGVSEEDAKKYTCNSSKKINIICPHCKSKLLKTIGDINNNKSIGCDKCGDGNSFSEKFISSFITQCSIDFITQLGFKNFDWCGRYKYDFYFELDDEKYIVETHGKQHYDGGFSSFGGRTLEEEQENDRVKMELALKNGIKPENYIVLNCSYSDKKYIVDAIINSRLNHIIDCNCVDFDKCEKFALGNILASVCNYWNSSQNTGTDKIAKIFNIDRSTVIRYLNKGASIGLCDYNANKKIVYVYDENMQFVGKYNSLKECSDESINVFGVKFSISKMCLVCNKQRKRHKGFIFSYIPLHNIEQ